MCDMRRSVVLVPWVWVSLPPRAGARARAAARADHRPVIARAAARAVITSRVQLRAAQLYIIIIHQ